LGLRLVAMPAHAAGLVRVRNGDQGLACRATAGRHEHITADVSRVAVLPDAAFEHGYGAGEEHIAIASRYAELVEDTELREAVFPRLRAEWQCTIDMLLAITGQQALLEQNPLLARSIKNRFPYLDPLNHVQVELLKRHRAGKTDERVVQAIHLTINGIAAGLRNSG